MGFLPAGHVFGCTDGGFCTNSTTIGTVATPSAPVLRAVSNFRTKATTGTGKSAAAAVRAAPQNTTAAEGARGVRVSGAPARVLGSVWWPAAVAASAPLRSLRASVRAARRWLFPGLAWGALALLRLLAAVHTAAGVAFAAGCVGVGPYPVGLCVGAVWVR